MARKGQNNGQSNDRDGDNFEGDERLGRSGGSGGDVERNIAGLEPAIPVSAQFETGEDDFREHATGDHAYNRDDSDRLSDEREHQERDLTDSERLELFRMSLFQNQLPAVAPLPGYHMCWLTTANPRDPIQGRLRLGYELVKPEEVPGWEHNILTSGQYQGCIGVNEMVLAKLPLRLYEMYMVESHHNQPLAEEGKLKSTLDAIRDQAAGKGARVDLEEGSAALGRSRRPHFEEVHGSRRSGLAG